MMAHDAWQEYERIAPGILGRELVTVPRAQLGGSVAGKRVLVTGAGGFIGSALVRQLAQLDPAGITLCDNGEHPLYEIDRELRQADPAFPVEAVICDVRDRVALGRLCETRRPQVVFHAAALKQLPLTEANLREAVLTNVIGTANLAECCATAEAEALVHISTDKAADPSSVLGMSKQLAELVCRDADSRTGMRCASVRFSNVFGSSGSVVPLFLEQLAQGIPLTITHAEMNRYFVTVGEATQLVLAALGMCLSDDCPAGPVFLLESGSALSIVDLARRLADLSKPGCVPTLEFVGIRDGEKLDESLTAPWELRSATASPQIALAHDQRAPLPDLAMLLARIRKAAERFDESELRRMLQAATTVRGGLPKPVPDSAAV